MDVIGAGCDIPRVSRLSAGDLSSFDIMNHIVLHSIGCILHNITQMWTSVLVFNIRNKSNKICNKRSEVPGAACSVSKESQVSSWIGYKTFQSNWLIWTTWTSTETVMPFMPHYILHAFAFRTNDVWLAIYSLLVEYNV